MFRPISRGRGLARSAASRWLPSDKAYSQMVVAVGIYDGHRVNLPKKYDYPNVKNAHDFPLPDK